MPTIYEYTYFSQQKVRLDPELRLRLNSTMTNMRMSQFQTPKKVAGGGQNLVKKAVNMDTGLNSDVWECRIDAHWRVFYFTNPGGNISVLCIGHLDDNGRLMMP